jgi:putative transposase
VIGWGWFYLSTILNDFSRYIIACKLCTTMRADDVTDTRLGAQPSSNDTKPQLLSTSSRSPSAL